VLIRHPRRFMTPSFNNRRHQARWTAIRLRARPGEDPASSHGYGLELAFSPGPPGSPGSPSQGRTARTPGTEPYFPGRSDSSRDPTKPAPNGGSARGYLHSATRRRPPGGFGYGPDVGSAELNIDTSPSLERSAHVARRVQPSSALAGGDPPRRHADPVTYVGIDTLAASVSA
jgi:hypothetical protein